jgi:hypothetical protein
MSQLDAVSHGCGTGCLIIEVTEKGVKLWSLTLKRGQRLDQETKDSVFYSLAQKYGSLKNKKERSQFLQEVDSVIFPHLGWELLHRKSLIRKLSLLSRQSPTLEPQKRGRKSVYNDIEKGHLVRLWQLAGYLCSKRLKALLPEWLEHYSCSENIKIKLKKISASQMDIFLKKPRIDYARKVHSETIPAKNHIKQLIRLRDPNLRHSEPGYCETDTVLHCGSFIWGTYAHSVSMTDLRSGWTKAKTVFGKNAELVVGALQSLEAGLPFPLKALFFDNGIEFVNHLLVTAFKINKGIDVARGRSGRSNDQCHIEQKNHTFVRQIFGHVRIEDPNLIPLMNEIYEVWGLLHNYFMPQTKLISKDRLGTKVRKRYDTPKTPYQRLMESETVSQEVKDSLTKTKSGLNPFKLQAELQQKLARFHKLNDEYNQKLKTSPD